MRRGSWLHATAAAALVATLSGSARAVDIELDAVPKPVLESVQGRFKDAKVAGAAQEKTPEGTVVYEISMEEAGKSIDVSLNPEGVILLIQKEVARKDLPKEIIAAVDAEFPKARYRHCQQIIPVDPKEGEKLTGYEVLVMTTAKQLRAVQLSVEGKITKIEKQNADEEEE